jgi:plastocyanin
MAVFVAAILVGAGLTAAGFRWAPAFGALLSVALLALFGPPMLEIISRPAVQGVMFPIMAVMLAALVAAVGCGIAASVQSYRACAGQQALPRGVAAALVLVAGLIAGASAVALAPQEGTTVGVSAETMAALPALGTSGWEFDQRELHVKAGQVVMLRLSNADPEAHYLDIDELDVHAPIAPGKTSMAVFTAPATGTYTFYCHPHADKANGEGMVGTLIVEE